MNTHLDSSICSSNVRKRCASSIYISMYAKFTPKQLRGPFENTLSAVSHALASGPNHRSGRNSSGRLYMMGDRCTNTKDWPTTVCNNLVN